MSATTDEGSSTTKDATPTPKESARLLTKLHGIGDILARRLVEAGYDTFERVAAAGEEGLKAIAGINRRQIPAILQQAQELATKAGKEGKEIVDELKARAAALKQQIEALAQTARERYAEELSGSVGAKLEKEFSKIVTSLEKVEKNMEGRVKQAGKGLRKAERRLEGLADAGLKKVGKKLKRARKSLKKVYASR